jgi:leucyl-tRNA synthetase
MAPIAPFISEELWQQTGHQESVHLQDWPTWDPEIAEERVIQIPVQINGKKRAVIEVEAPAMKTEVEKAAFISVKVQKYISGQIVKDMIYIPGKILNILTENHP